MVRAKDETLVHNTQAFVKQVTQYYKAGATDRVADLISAAIGVSACT